MTQEAYAQTVRAFHARSFAPGAFGHAEHVLVAFELLKNREFMDAAAAFSAGIREIAAKAGAHQKFNMTITIAFLSLIAERLAASPSDGYDAFAARNPDLYRRDALAALYSPERLQGEAARHVFLLPDRAA